MHFKAKKDGSLENGVMKTFMVCYRTQLSRFVLVSDEHTNGEHTYPNLSENKQRLVPLTA
jgi:hypothetical protein